MTMTNKMNRKSDSIILATIEELVPQDHLVRKLEDCIDFTFIYPKVKHLYSEVGRPSVDPVILFKMVFINIIFGNNSMRKTCKDIEVNLAYRWFLGIEIHEPVPNYSTWSQNYIRRYADSTIFEEIFTEILSQAMNYDFLDLETVYGDSTHQKANANKRKGEAKMVDLEAKKYEIELLNEINHDREMCGKKTYETLVKTEMVNDEETGKEIEVVQQKRMKQSTTDPEAGNYHKGEKEQCFAYSHQSFCDKNGFVLSATTVAGNVHDSVSFFEAYKALNKNLRPYIKNVCLDAGYMTPAICKTIIENGQEAYMPYKRPMTKKGFFKKYEYVYDEDYDYYLCPNDQALLYTTTTKEGYREYKSDPKVCVNCPMIDTCTKSKNHIKVIHRHVWESFREHVDETRHTDKWKEIYPVRKESIERVYADCKENHGLRYTRLKGLKKNQHQVWLIFACHNLKKMALWSWNGAYNKSIFTHIIDSIRKILKTYIIKRVLRNGTPLMSTV